MDYFYNYAAGGMAKIEVSEEWANKLSQLDHEEKLNNRRETRRHVHISNMPLGTESFVSNEPDPLHAMCRRETYGEVSVKLKDLTERQQKALRMRLNGYKEADIAARLGISQQAVSKMLMAIRKKLSE